MDGEFEHAIQKAVAELVALCPWMDQTDVGQVETVFRAHGGLVVGKDVDVEEMAMALSKLAGRAEVVGDRRRAWAFRQWYEWACASMRGEEYHESDLPPELAGE